jgi:hypothetical protein
MGAHDNMNTSTLLKDDLVNPSSEIRLGALRAVSAWIPKQSIADALMECAKVGQVDEALTAYSYLTSRLGTKVEDRINLLKKAQALATTPASKNALIEATVAIAHPNAKVLAKELQAPAAEQRISATISKIKVVPAGNDFALPAADAYIMGPTLGAATLDPATKAITGWNNPDTFVGWDVEFKEAREVRIQLSLTNTAPELASYRVMLASASAPIIVAKSPSETQPVSTEIIIHKVIPGIYRLVIAPANLPDGQSLMNLRGVVLLKK